MHGNQPFFKYKVSIEDKTALDVSKSIFDFPVKVMMQVRSRKRGIINLEENGQVFVHQRVEFVH